MFGEIKQFSSPEEEIAFLREQISQHHSPEHSPETAAESIVEQYAETKPETMLAPEHHLDEPEVEGISLSLSPEEHDDQIGGLYHVMLEKGVRNAMMVVERLGNPHLQDDFHRFLVQYLVAGGDIPDSRNARELLDNLDQVLFEITMPGNPEERRSHKELISIMEQFYAGMQTITGTAQGKSRTYTLEIALPSEGDDLVFYAGVPTEHSDRFQKHVLGLYPEARVEPAPNDNNVFTADGQVVGAYASHTNHAAYPLKTYDQFEIDPIGVILNTFTKLAPSGEGAALQVIVQNTDDEITKTFQDAAHEVAQGLKLGEAVYKAGRKGIGKMFDNALGVTPKPKEDAVVDQDAIEALKEKTQTHITKTNIRVIASAPTTPRAQEIVHDLTSAFHQFSKPRTGGLSFTQIKPRKLPSFIKEFTFRTYNPKQMLHLSYRELASLYHFPITAQAAPELKTSRATTAAAPTNVTGGDLLLGHNRHRGLERPVYLKREDRMRHFYVIGQTGTGKTGTMLTMIRQDIEAGEGVCYIDPHGSDVQTILSFIPPHRHQDVIYFDPAYTARPMGLNMLEYDANYPEQKTLVIDELMGIFNQLFDMAKQGGAMFQQYFKNSAFLVMDSPETGNTLLEITRVLGDKNFRTMKLKSCKNPIVRQFWENAEKTTGDQSLANFVPYISSKFDPLISNEILRPVIVQEQSAFNVRDVMDNKKILLVNLSKGRLGELNANLIGLILVGKIQMAALSRADSYGAELSDFYLYIDEFQNVTTPSIASILSEARKYRLSLNMAHQYLSQLSEDIRNAVLGNVGSMGIFRISPEDAKQLEPRVQPSFTADDIIKQDNYNCYLSMIADGQPAEPFNAKIKYFGEGNKDQVEAIKQLSYQTYGRDRAEVEAEIMKKYEKKEPEKPKPIF